MSEFVHGPVGENTEHAISKMRDEQERPETGNILRRVCQWAGEGACQHTCQLTTDTITSTEIADIFAKRACADLNLFHALNELGLNTTETLMVGVTANEVGFADELDKYEKVRGNTYGWRELPGFNAFFARESELEAIGRRLADCADINLEFKDTEGNTVFGFEHGTRPNMFGSSKFAFEKDGKKMSFTEYTMRQAIEHYGADPTSMKIKLAAVIKPHNFTKHFDDAEKMEEHLPGWYEDGFLHNISNPDWQPGDPVTESDTWEADTAGMIVRDIKAAMAELGVPEENFDMSESIDPGDSKGVHSSHQYSADYGDTRDLYITYMK